MARGAIWALALFAVIGPAVSDRHSLYYIYTALSKDVKLPGIYEFTALGLLDDREIDYYSSKDQVKVPKQDWMRDKMQEDYWDKGTQSRKSKEQWFKVNVGILMERMRHNKSDLHVLQWRHGCEINELNGRTEFVKGIDEYSYDGSEFLSFDDEHMRWIAPIPAAEPTKRKWDDVAILNQYTKGYLTKECVDWLTKFMDYGKESLRKHSSPDVYVFAKRSTTDSDKLILTCLATGFYPKDVKLVVRKYSTSLPEHMLISTGVRPNDDGTFQLRKSLDIQESDSAKYDCHVTHSSLQVPIIKEWDKTCNDCSNGMILGVGAGIGALVLMIAVIGVILLLKKKGIIGGAENLEPKNASQSSVTIPFIANMHEKVNSNLGSKADDTDSGHESPSITSSSVDLRSESSASSVTGGDKNDGSPYSSNKAIGERKMSMEENQQLLNTPAQSAVDG